MRDLSALKAAGTEPVFGTRYAYGRHTPSQEVQDLFARAVPHSSKLLLEPPAPFDPLLYHALDFQNVLAGRALLLRVIAPWEVEMDGRSIMVHDDDEGQADVDAVLGDDARKSLPPLDFGTYTILCGEVVEAAACALYPAESSDAEGRRHMVDRLMSNVDILVAIRPRTFTEATRFLTDSLAAYRLSMLLGSDPPDVGVPEIHTQSQRIAAKWLYASLKALTEHPDFDDQDRSAFYRPPRSKITALEEALRLANCWYPEVT